MLREVRATFECDNCGMCFSVRVDAAWNNPSWSVFDYAEDAVLNSFMYEGPADYSCVRDNKHLCGRCTRKIDKEVKL